MYASQKRKKQRNGKSKRPKGKSKRPRDLGKKEQAEFDHVKRRSKNRGLPDLDYDGTLRQIAAGFSIRFNFINKAFDWIEPTREPDPKIKEAKDLFVAEVSKYLKPRWWLGERNRLDRHFGHLIPKPATPSSEPPPTKPSPV